MVKIRLKENGTEEGPSFRVAVADQRSPRDEDSSQRSVTMIQLRNQA